MHPAATRTEFLRLRAQGLSLASIGRRLGVSKPTLIKWSRQSQSEIAAEITADRQRIHSEIASAATQEIADLTRRLTGLRQELFSRAVRDIRTSDLEIIAGELRQRLDSLNALVGTTSTPSPSEVSSYSGPSEPTPTPKN